MEIAIEIAASNVIEITSAQRRYKWTPVDVLLSLCASELFGLTTI